MSIQDVHKEVRSHFIDSGYLSFVGNDAHVESLQVAFSDLVEKKQCTSFMLVGRSEDILNQIVQKALLNFPCDEKAKKQLKYVHLNGTLHTTDRLALQYIALELNPSIASSLNEEEPAVNEEEDMEEDGPIRREKSSSLSSESFATYFTNVMNGLRDNSTTGDRSLLIVLEEFEKFTEHSNQLLLYNLFDVTHSQRNPLCVIGLSTRLGVVQLLEKRVKSRFSHRIFQIEPPAATFDSYKELTIKMLTVSGIFMDTHAPCEQTDQTKRGKRGAANIPLSVYQESKFRSRILPDICVKWNQSIHNLFQDDIVQEHLKKAFHFHRTLSHLRQLLFLAVAKLCPEKPQLSPDDIVESFNILHARNYKQLLSKEFSIIEIALLTAVMLLQSPRRHDGRPVNFEMAYNEYLQLASEKTLPQFDKAAFLKAFESLMEHEYIVSAPGGSDIYTEDTSGPVQKSNASNVHMLPFRPVQCLMDVENLRMLTKQKVMNTDIAHWIMETTNSRGFSC